MQDLREEIFRAAMDRKVTAVIVADGEGILAETATVEREAERLGLTMESILADGTRVKAGDEIARFHGNPQEVALAEEALIGLMGRPSGIATAARDCVKAAGKKIRVVCGAWKKMPPSEKEHIRRAVVVGGAFNRITDDPFVYLDKNYLEMLGGIKESIAAVSHLEDRVVVVEIKGRYQSIIKEALEAVEAGARILFVDTGVPLDVMEVAFELNRAGLRKKVKIAFGGGIELKDLRKLKDLDINIVDIGKGILDAPMLDMRMEIVSVEGGGTGTSGPA